MKKIYTFYFRSLLLSLVMMLFFSCERKISDEAVFATLSKDGEIFTDTPVGMGSNFYFPYSGSKPDAFSVDNEEGYNSVASIRVDVPNADDPNGVFAGAIFRVDGEGRDLTGFDALTFWAKSSQGVALESIGFGQNFLDNKYEVTRSNISLSTQWTQFIIPIPDPSKLINERGMLWYSTGTQQTDGKGYTFWLDEIKFEKLGTIAQPRPKIFNGETLEQEAFVKIPITISGLTQTFNTATGENITTTIAPAYFEFSSSRNDIASIDETGIVNPLKAGTTLITANIANVPAEGMLKVTVQKGSFDFPSDPPTRELADVISIFSDVYGNKELEYYNGFFTPDGQKTKGGLVKVGNQNIIQYTDLNFVALKTKTTVDVSSMTKVHMDLKVDDDQIDSDDFINIILLAQMPDGTENQASVTVPASDLKSKEWISFDKPLTDFSGVDLTNLSLIFFVSDAKVSTLLVDNIYFYR